MNKINLKKNFNNKILYKELFWQISAINLEFMYIG